MEIDFKHSIDKCRCIQPGFCEFFRQEMTYDPPNWQWCQEATEQERLEYKKACDKKHDRKSYIFKGKFVTIADMAKDCQSLLSKLAQFNIKGVAGIPRSGMLPASMCALWLNIPLYTFNKSGQFELLSAITDFGGVRMQNHKETDGKMLVIDDTVYSGFAMRQAKEIFNDNDQIVYGSVYVHPKSVPIVDVFAMELEPPHFLEWNFFNSSYICNSLLDFDGILSPNVPYEKCQNEKDYMEYVTNVKPLYHRIPSTYACKGIVTARLEKYRDVTEKWLQKHGVKYGSLAMYPTEKKGILDANHVVEAAKFKAEMFFKKDAAFFVESEIAESALIRSQVHKTVICPDEGKFG